MAETGWVNAQASDSANIEINFADIERLRQTFIDHESEGKKVIQKLLELDKTLQDYWDGDAHKAFRTSIENYETAFTQEIKNALTYIGDIMANAAKRAKEYEEQMTTSATLDPNAGSTGAGN